MKSLTQMKQQLVTSKPHACGSSHSHSVLLSAAFHLEEMKASEKEMGLKRLRSPASSPLFSHCAGPAEPVLEQSPPAAGPKSSSQGETPATICAGGGMCRGWSARLCWGGEVEGWWTTATSAAPAGLPALGKWDRLAHSGQKAQRRSRQGFCQRKF